MLNPDPEAGPVSLDTNVIGLLTSRHPDRTAYERLLGARSLVVTYFVQGEIRARDWHELRFQEVRRLLERAEFLSSPSMSVIDVYVLLKRISGRLGLEQGSEREDLWMLAQSRDAGLVVMTDDRNAARVAKASGMEVLTNLRNIETYYARDRARLERQRLR